MNDTFVIGVDAGGTYTDAVLVSTKSRDIIASAKRPTSHHNLSLGIGASIEAVLNKLEAKLEQGENPDAFMAQHKAAKAISAVSVSTTLATNAVVENNHDTAVALIMIGWDNRMDVPGASVVRHVPGGHKIDGSEQDPMSLEAVVDIVLALRGRVDAYAVCGLMSFVNPAHENLVAKAIGMIDPKPVFCSHTVSKSAGMKERATTAVLNARLLPVMQQFLDGVTTALTRLSISAKVSVVCGDATVMSIDDAVRNAAATVASGPAATALFGATALKNQAETPQDALIVDIGGTTTDVTLLHNGQPVLAENGLAIGPWITHVRAVEMFTVGVGGDSHVRYTAKKLSIASRRVTPLCMVSPLQSLDTWLFAPDAGAEGGSCVMAMAKETTAPLSPEAQSLFQLLNDKNNGGPLDTITACKALTMPRITLEKAIAQLVHHQLIAEIGFTPTDALHCTGALSFGDTEQAKRGANLLAKLMQCTEEEAIDAILIATQRRIEDAIVEHVARREVGGNFVGYLQQRHQHSLLRLSLSLAVPMVGIGAAARYLLPEVAHKLGTSSAFPPHYDVGNALGAALLALDTDTTN